MHEWFDFGIFFGGQFFVSSSSCLHGLKFLRIAQLCFSFHGMKSFPKVVWGVFWKYTSPNYANPKEPKSQNNQSPKTTQREDKIVNHLTLFLALWDNLCFASQYFWHFETKLRFSSPKFWHRKQNCESHHKSFDTVRQSWDFRPTVFFQNFCYSGKIIYFRMVSFCQVDLRCGSDFVQCRFNDYRKFL